jgi:hypothetical protein
MPTPAMLERKEWRDDNVLSYISLLSFQRTSLHKELNGRNLGIYFEGTCSYSYPVIKYVNL